MKPIKHLTRHPRHEKLLRHVQTQTVRFSLGFSPSSARQRILEAAKKAQTPQRSDVEAIRTDWVNVGKDWRAIFEAVDLKKSR